MRKWIPLVVVALVAGAIGIAQLSHGEQENALAACLEQPGAADPAQATGPCALRSAPETYADLADASNAVAQRVAADSTADYAATARKRSRLADANAAPVPGANGSWRPLGRGPLH